jgi:DTW domain-containing protein
MRFEGGESDVCNGVNFLMSRVTCYRCFWPQAHCWCDRIIPTATRTRFVFLMHPKEYRHEKAATGRLTHLSLPNSEIIVGVAFDQNERLAALLGNPTHRVVLLYPGEDATNLSQPERAMEVGTGLPLVVLVLDATWSCARKMLKLSPRLQQLPRVMFTPSAPSRFVIKAQPIAGCLSTLESVHEVLQALARAGVEPYEQDEQLLTLFAGMQQFQIDCAQDPDRGGYRRNDYKEPGERKPFSGQSGRRRANFFKVSERGKAEN